MISSSKTWLACAFFALTASLAGSARAGTDTDNMTVTATVIASCDVTANPLAFGNYDPVSSTPLDAATTVSVFCTNGTSYEVTMGAGLGSGATVTARKLTWSGNLLTYSIYRDAGRSNVWGVTTGSNVVTGTGTGVSQSLNVYGRIPVNQTAPAGAYSDTVVVSVNY